SARGRSTGTSRGRSGGSARSGRPSGSSRRGRGRRPTPLLVRLVRGLWMAVAHLVGGIARRLGSSARGLDPAPPPHRLRLALIGAAWVVAAGEWWALPGPAGNVIPAVVAGTLGRVALVLPLALVVLAALLMRHPDRIDTVNRVALGLLAVTVAATGLVHLW